MLSLSGAAFTAAEECKRTKYSTLLDRVIFKTVWLEILEPFDYFARRLLRDIAARISALTSEKEVRAKLHRQIAAAVQANNAAFTISTCTPPFVRLQKTDLFWPDFFWIEQWSRSSLPQASQYIEILIHYSLLCDKRIGYICSIVSEAHWPLNHACLHISFITHKSVLYTVLLASFVSS